MKIWQLKNRGKYSPTPELKSGDIIADLLSNKFYEVWLDRSFRRIKDINVITAIKKQIKEEDAENERNSQNN